MNNNTYGIVKPAHFDIDNDAEIWYHYKPTRNSEDLTYQDFKRIEKPSDILTNAKIDNGVNYYTTNLMGMFTLKLPVTLFGQVGIYTIYIKPREYKFNILDVGVLGAYPDVKGIVINKDQYPNTTLLENGNAVGYRVDYLNGKEKEEYYRIVTGNNLCACLPQTLTNLNMDTNAYRFVDSGNLVFLTLQPSIVSSYRANAKPFIGIINQEITLSNTKFDPISLEIEITKHDLENIYDTLNGSQIHSLDNGVITTYNSNKEPILQHEYFTVKDDYRNETYRTRINQENNLRPLPDSALLENS